MAIIIISWHCKELPTKYEAYDCHDCLSSVKSLRDLLDMAQTLYFARPPHLASRNPLVHHLHPLLLGPERDGVPGPQDCTPVGDDAWISPV